VKYKGKSYFLNIANIHNSDYQKSLFTLDDIPSGRPPLISSAEQDETILFKSLRSMFGSIQGDETASGATDTQWTSAADLLPEFFKTANVEQESASEWIIAPIIPEPVRFYAMRNLHPDYMLCLLGGGPACRFNNIWMAQSAARLVSSSQIKATLEKRARQPFSPLPPPFDQREWTNAHLFEPLFEVGIKGTAKDMRSVYIPNKCASLASSDCYLALYKTGTLDERAPGRESESLLFVVGLWRRGAFVPENTLAGFIYMEDSKKKKTPKCADCEFNKFKFAGPIIRDVVLYLQAIRPAERAVKSAEKIKTTQHKMRKE
jgi:hypothetical protein